MPTLFGKNCATDRALIGFEPCSVDPGPLLGHIVLPGRPQFDVATTTADKAFFNNLVQQGQAYFIADAFSSPVETAAPTTETSDITQRQVVVTRGLPIVTTTLKSSYERHKNIYKLSSQDEVSVFLVYQNAIKVNVSKDRLSFGGFNVGMYEVLTYQEASGTTKAQTQIMFQITDLEGYNTGGGYLYNLDFNPNTGINNVTDVYMTGRAVVTGSGSDNPANRVYVTAVWGANDLSNISGLSAPNFRLYVNGVVAPITAPISRNENFEYVLTPTTPLTGTPAIRVELYDATATPPINVAKVGVNNPKFYLGDTGTFTASA